MSFFSKLFAKIKAMFMKKAEELVATKVVISNQTSFPNDPPVVYIPPANPKMIDPNASAPWVPGETPQNTPAPSPAAPSLRVGTVNPKDSPQTMAEAMKGQMFDPIDVIAVAPTGVNAPAMPRIWPKPHPENGENAWGYATRCSYIDNPATGQKFVNQQALGMYTLGTPGPMLSYVTSGQFAHVADYHMYREDWMTARELDQQAKERARDVASNAGFSPR